MARNSAYPTLFNGVTAAPRSITVTMDRPYWKGPKPLAGREQMVTSSAGGWKFKYNNIPLYGLNGRSIQSWMSLYMYNPLVHVRPILGANRLINRVSTTGISYILSSAAAAGDYNIYVSRTGTTQSSFLIRSYIEINGRVHWVWNAYNSSGNIDVLQIWPPLRGAYAANTAIEINDPQCICSVVTDENAISFTQELGTLGFLSVEFIEASWPNSASFP